VKAVGGVLSASLLLSASVSAAPPAASRARLFRHEGTRLSMACAYTIVAYGPDAQALPPTVEAALDEVDRIDRLMSHYRPESPLSRLNREASGGPLTVADTVQFDVDSAVVRPEFGQILGLGALLLRQNPAASIICLYSSCAGKAAMDDARYLNPR